MTKKSISPLIEDLRSILIKEVKAMEIENYDQCEKLLDELLEKVDKKLREGGSFEEIKRVVVDFIMQKEREALEEP